MHEMTTGLTTANEISVDTTIAAERITFLVDNIV